MAGGIANDNRHEEIAEQTNLWCDAPLTRVHHSVIIQSLFGDNQPSLEARMEDSNVTQQGGQSARFTFTKETLRTLHSSVRRPGGINKAEDTSPSTSDTCNTSDNCCCCVIAL